MNEMNLTNDLNGGRSTEWLDCGACTVAIGAHHRGAGCALYPEHDPEDYEIVEQDLKDFEDVTLVGAGQLIDYTTKLRIWRRVSRVRGERAALRVRAV